MPIGFLQLDPEYIERDYPGVKNRWFDEPKNSVVAFQFDPADVKLVIPTKWKDDKPETATLLQIGMNYDRETTENQDRIDIKLIFSDVVLNRGTISHDQLALTKRKPNELPAGVPNTQRSLEILEAMALPVTGRAAQVIESVYFRYSGAAVTQIAQQDYRTLRSLSVWDRLYPRRARPTVPPSLSESFFGPTGEKITVKGKRLVLAPHPPRPLVLHLITPNPFKCVLQGLEIEILNLDNITGAPIVATVKVKLVAFNREIFEDGYDGLIQSKTINLGEQNEENEEALSLEDWNRKITSGANVIATVPPTRDLVFTEYKVSTQQTTVTADLRDNLRDRARFSRYNSLIRQRKSITNKP